MSDTAHHVPERTTLPIAIVVLLAALGVPRIVVHDLGVLTSGPLYTALVLAPPLVWLAVVLARRVTAPFTTLLKVGLAYGLMLAVTHQILWAVSFGAGQPDLGGNLAGVLPEAVEAVVLRAVAVVSSVVTGLVVGVVTGLVAELAMRIAGARGRYSRKRPRPGVVDRRE